jgi:hypothetical protein
MSAKFTFRERSVIDYAISSINFMQILSCFKVQEVDALFSDGHSLLDLELKTYPDNTENQLDENNTHNLSRVPDISKPPRWKTEKQDDFVQNISQRDINEIIRNIDSIQDLSTTKSKLNCISEQIASLFHSSARRSFPAKQNNRSYNNKNYNNNKNKPWFGPHCKKARHKYHVARKQYMTHKNDQYRTQLARASKHYKQVMNTYINKHKFENERKLRQIHTKNPKDYWKILNSIKPQDSSKQPSIDDFYNYFNGANNSDENRQQINEDFFDNRQPNLELLNGQITESEILKAISKCKNCKAASPQDFIYNEYIKSTKQLMIPLYIRLFNLILDSGQLPDPWLVGTIKPIYKRKGPSVNPENYRPITILSCLGKLFTSILNDRITKFLDDNAILKENQAGFRHKYSTTDHVFALKFIVDNIRRQRKKLFVSYIDFSSAFDNVWRAGLWQKLIQNGITGKVLKVIFNMYANIKSCVSANNCISPFFTSPNGLRQGENLSPILFALYLNDLEDYLQQRNHGVEFVINENDFNIYIKLFVLLYADDTVLMSEDQESFQNLLNDFSDYCKLWKLQINMNKTKVMVFGTNKPEKYKFYLNGTILETVKEYKYLGVIFSSSGSFLNARKSIAEQANKAMHLLYTRIYNLDLPIDLQLKLFDQTILPILTYNSEIWGVENIDIIERIHTDFLRKITKSKMSTPLYMLYAELGRFPIKIIIKSRMIKLWASLISSHETKLSRLCYMYMLRSNFTFSWMQYVKSILDSTGNTHFWLNQFGITLNNAHKLVKQTLTDQFLQTWSNSVMESSKGINYRIFKDNISFEDYMKILPSDLRISLFHYRTGNHRLPIETSRWAQNYIPFEHRRCMYCDSNDPPDEYHYLIKCPIFCTQRKKYIPKRFLTRPNILKFRELLNNKSYYLLRNIAIFVKEIMNFHANN